MKQWIIDRFEGNCAVCKGDREETTLIERAGLPKDAKVGSVLRIAESGSVSLDLDETKRRRKRILEKLHRLLEEE